MLSTKAVWAIHTTEAIPDELLTSVLEIPRAAEILPPENWEPIYSCLPYMNRRGITMADVKQFGLFWCPQGRYRNRIVFPVWEGNRLVYWQARALYEKEDCSTGKFLKSLNPPRVEGSVVSTDVLMNLDTAALYPRVAIVEGPTDLVRTGPDAVCTFGKQMTSTQIGRLLRADVKAVDLMWDGPTDREPQGAHPEMLALASQLAPFFDVRLVFLPQGDPGDWPRETLTELRATGVPASEFSRVACL